nr:hypothetical protein GCM10025732_02410 [Glycomyces mayteni]
MPSPGRGRGAVGVVEEFADEAAGVVEGGDDVEVLAGAGDHDVEEVGAGEEPLASGAVAGGGAEEAMTVSDSEPWKAWTVPVLMRWARMASRSKRFMTAASMASAWARNGERTARPRSPAATSSARRSTARSASAGTVPSSAAVSAATRWTVMASVSWRRGWAVMGRTRPP